MCSLPCGVQWYSQSGRKLLEEKNLSTTISDILLMQIEPGNTTTQHPIKKTSPVNVSKILRIFQLCIDFNAHSSFYQCQKFIFTWFALLLLLRYPIGNYRFKILPQIMSSVHLFKKGKTSISSVNCPLFEIEALANCWQRMSAFLLKTSKKLSRIWKWNAGVKSRRFFLHLSPVKFDVKEIRLRMSWYSIEV